MHPITDLQTSLLTSLRAEVALSALLSGDAIFDTPPQRKKPPYITIVRHDILSRDADLAFGHEHRLVLHCRVLEASRKSVLALVDRVVFVTTAASLSTATLLVTRARHDRTETAIDLKTGHARAAVFLKFFTEPAT